MSPVSRPVHPPRAGSPSRPHARTRRPARRVARSVGPALAAVCALVAAAPAGAAPPAVPVVEQPLQPAGDVAAVATGEGVQAWTTKHLEPGAKKLTLDVWWRTDGAPVKAGSIPDTGFYNEQSGISASSTLEVGRNRAGTPVALIRTSGKNDMPPHYTTAMDLRTGKTSKLPITRDGLLVGGFALDHGTAYFTLYRKNPTSRSTAALWSAPMRGTTLGRAKKVRTSKRGDIWFDVLADQGRVGLNESTSPPKDPKSPYAFANFIDDFAFGTPRGTWRRTDLIGVSDGPYPTHVMAGFTAGGKGLVVLRTQRDDGRPSLVTMTPQSKGAKKQQVLLGSDYVSSPDLAALDATTGRLLTAGPGPDGTAQVGLSGVAFKP